MLYCDNAHLLCCCSTYDSNIHNILASVDGFFLPEFHWRPLQCVSLIENCLCNSFLFHNRLRSIGISFNYTLSDFRTSNRLLFSTICLSLVLSYFNRFDICRVLRLSSTVFNIMQHQLIIRGLIRMLIVMITSLLKACYLH